MGGEKGERTNLAQFGITLYRSFFKPSDLKLIESQLEIIVIEYKLHACSCV